MAEMTDLELLEKLGVDTKPEKKTARTPREERIIAGFEEIQKFYEDNERLPGTGEDRDIFERLYAVRLGRIRKLSECRNLVKELDHQGLLEGSQADADESLAEVSDEELLEQLGVPAPKEGDVTHLRHVKPRAEVRAAEEIASRTRCEDFDKFKPLFEKIQEEIKCGMRETRPFELKAEIRPGSLFVVGGQKAYVATMGEVFTNAQGRTDARLRVIFDNGTESNMLMRSLQRALNKDEAGRRITDPVAGPLFSDQHAEGDLATGTIYVLRSKSDHSVVAANRELIHKIGVTNINVEKRIAGARLQPTFLMADVEVVATYELYNVNRTKLENLIHRIFDAARLNIEIKDRFGKPVTPREWFLVPLATIDDAVEKIKDGTITRFIYDPREAKLTPRE